MEVTGASAPKHSYVDMLTKLECYECRCVVVKDASGRFQVVLRQSPATGTLLLYPLMEHYNIPLLLKVQGLTLSGGFSDGRWTSARAQSGWSLMPPLPEEFVCLLWKSLAHYPLTTQFCVCLYSGQNWLLETPHDKFKEFTRSVTCFKICRKAGNTIKHFSTALSLRSRALVSY